MRKRNKNLIILSITTIILLIALGITYAVYQMSITGSNQELIVGDIYMKYTETNQITLDNAMPFDISELNVVNPIMKTQTYEEDTRNELTQCVDYLYSWNFLEGEDAESYCKGTGTLYGNTFQDDIDRGYFPEFMLTGFKDKNIISSDKKVNPIMASQTYEDTRNELSKCVDYFSDYSFMSGEDAESYCKGTGTLEGYTFQQNIDDSDYFDSEELTFLKNKNLLVSSMYSLPYFEFKITGKNTYTKKDIWYEIVLSHGDSHATRTTRIRDDLLRFTLVEIKDGVETTVRENISYDDLSSKRIYVNTIEKNTTSEVDITYRLYMWIDYNTVIGNVDEDYTIDEWNDVYASIKVNVTGDFNEKELPYEEKYNVTDASCFTTKIVTNYVVNDVMKTQTYTSGGTNELSQCVDYFLPLYYYDEGSTAESFCKGIGTVGGNTLQNMLEMNFYNLNRLTYLKNENIIVEQGEVIEITGYDSSCGSDVVIPKTINNLEVIVIGESAFSRKNLTSVVIPNSVKRIREIAFYGNNLTSVEFEKNSTLLRIEDETFIGENQQITEVFIPESVISLSCDAFNYDVIIHKSNDLFCYSTPQ